MSRRRACEPHFTPDKTAPRVVPQSCAEPGDYVIPRLVWAVVSPLLDEDVVTLGSDVRGSAADRRVADASDRMLRRLMALDTLAVCLAKAPGRPGVASRSSDSRPTSALRRDESGKSGERGLHQLDDPSLHHGAPLLEPAHHRPPAAFVEVRHRPESQCRVPVAELPASGKRATNLPSHVRVVGIPYQVLGDSSGGSRSRSHALVQRSHEPPMPSPRSRPGRPDRRPAGRPSSPGHSGRRRALHRGLLLGAEAWDSVLGVFADIRTTAFSALGRST